MPNDKIYWLSVYQYQGKPFDTNGTSLIAQEGSYKKIRRALQPYLAKEMVHYLNVAEIGYTTEVAIVDSETQKELIKVTFRGDKKIRG